VVRFNIKFNISKQKTNFLSLFQAITGLDLKNEIKNSLTSNTSSNNNNTNKSFLKTWQLALAVGIPSAVIIAYFIYKRRNSTSKPATLNNNSQEQKKDETVKKTLVKKSPLEQAIDFKNDGNKYFQQKKYQEALECYSKAIELCPQDNKDELPKFYQNRAASFENLV
jgi:import receptor subunit TOM70